MRHGICDKEVMSNLYDYKNSKVETIFSKSSPSDYVKLNKESFETIENLLINMGLKRYECPADIFKSKTIPIKDIVICITDKVEGCTDAYIRVLVNDDDIWILYTFRSLITNRVFLDVMNVYMPHENKLYIDFVDVWCNDVAKQLYDHLRINYSSEDWKKYQLELAEERQDILVIWYAIQVLLLNPDIKKSDVLQQKGKEKIPEVIFGKQIQNKRKRKTKYMKRLYFNSDFFGTRKEFERHTLCWYVIGHYRKHGEGKVWVNGYWKGPMRHAKKNLDEGRERIINYG